MKREKVLEKLTSPKGIFLWKPSPLCLHILPTRKKFRVWTPSRLTRYLFMTGGCGYTEASYKLWTYQIQIRCVNSSKRYQVLNLQFCPWHSPIVSPVQFCSTPQHSLQLLQRGPTRATSQDLASRTEYSLPPTPLDRRCQRRFWHAWVMTLPRPQMFCLKVL